MVIVVIHQLFRLGTSIPWLCNSHNQRLYPFFSVKIAVWSSQELGDLRSPRAATSMHGGSAGVAALGLGGLGLGGHHVGRGQAQAMQRWLAGDVRTT